MSDAQLHISFNDTVVQSHAVSFFRSILRWPNASKEFGLSFDYLTPVALTALIPLFIAVIIIILFLIQLILRYTRLEDKIDTRVFQMRRSRRFIILQISLAVILIFFITLFIGVAMISVVALNFSFQDGLNVIDGVATDLFHVGSGLVDVAQLFRTRIENFEPVAPPGTVPSLALGDVVTPALKSLKTFVLDRYPNVGPLDAAITTRYEQVKSVLSVVSRAVQSVSGGLLAIVLLLLSAPGLHFLIDAMPLNRRYRFCRIFFHFSVVMFPTLLALSFLGVMSAVGATLGDICASLHDYRAVLLDDLQAAAVPENAFVKGNVLCPDLINSDSLNEQFDGTIATILQNEFARTTIKFVINSTAEVVAETATWSRDKVMRYVDCSALITFSGKLEFIACGREGKSAIQAVFDLWVAFLGMGILLTVAVICSLMGVRIGWGLLVWPREHIDSEVSLEEAVEEAEEKRYDWVEGGGEGEGK